MQKPKAFGESLTLIRTGGGEAFGFRWSRNKGVLWVEQDPKWVRAPGRREYVANPRAVYEAAQFVPKRQRQGVLVGYMLRLLDCTNKPYEHVEQALLRLVAELRIAGHSSRVVWDATRVAEKQALMSFSNVKQAAGWSLEEAKQFANV